MKRINRKGFTLIELLAVIVILAIIVVVTVPTILNSIDDARLSSLHSLSKEVANWYDTSVAQDQLAITGNKLLGTAIVPDDGKWYCLKNVKNGENSLFEMFGLSENDVYPGYKDENTKTYYDIPDDLSFDESGKVNSVYPGGDYCSAIRINNVRAEVLLIATEEGKFNTGWDYRTYAISSGSNGYDEVSS